MAQKQKQAKCPLIHEWINKMWKTHTHNETLFYLEFILTHAIKWLTFDCMKLSEISHKRMNIVRFHLYEFPRIVKFV